MIEVGVGFDPASSKLGVCAVSLRDAMAVPGTAHTFSVSGELSKRLVKLRIKITDFLGVLEEEYIIRFVCLENPAMANIKRRNRHDTAFVLGRAFEMTYRSVEAHAALVGRAIPIYETIPAESSTAVGCKTTATKLERNIATSRVNQGTFDVDREICVGGLLDGAGPDALDACAAGISGWGQWKQQFIVAAASQQAMDNGKTTKRKRKSRG